MQPLPKSVEVECPYCKEQITVRLTSWVTTKTIGVPDPLYVSVEVQVEQVRHECPKYRTQYKGEK